MSDPTLPSSTLPSRRTVLLSLGAVPLLPALAACSDSEAADPEATTSSSRATGTPLGSDGAAAQVTVTDPWVKAADDGMTAAFGTLHNTGDTGVTLVSQLHETTSDGSGGMSMQEKEGGFPILPGADLVLEPGGNHLMLMDLTEPLQPGDTVEFAVAFDDDSTGTLTATVKDFAGAQENYGGMEDDASDGGGMDPGMGDMSDAGGEH
jgi:copper(I)-binding protein